MRRAALLAAALLLLDSCTYGPVVVRHRFANAMAEPGGHAFAVILLTTESREPTGLSRFPDGGRTRILSERMGLWLCDADRGTAARIATMPRPAEIQSGFSAWIVGWDPPGESTGVYVEVSGHRGATSDTPFLRWLVRIGVAPETGGGTAFAFLPNEAVRPRGPGPLRGGREIQVSLGVDTISVRADTRPEFAPMFRVDPRTGELALLPGASPLGAGVEERAARATGTRKEDAFAALRAHPLAPTGPRPAPAIWCDSVQLFLRQFASSPIRRGNEPYVDPLAVRPFPACSVELDEPWAAVDPRRTPWGALGEWLSTHGFVRDARYDAHDPDGTSALYRRGDRFCGYAASWQGAATATENSGPPTGKKIGGPAEGPPTRYRLTAWSGVGR